MLSVVQKDSFDVGMGLGFSEDDLMDGYSSQDGSIVGHETSSRRSRKLSGSRAWERGHEGDVGDGGYDIVLINEIPYLSGALQNLYALIKKVSLPIPLRRTHFSFLISTL